MHVTAVLWKQIKPKSITRKNVSRSRRQWWGTAKSEEERALPIKKRFADTLKEKIDDAKVPRTKRHHRNTIR